MAKDKVVYDFSDDIPMQKDPREVRSARIQKDVYDILLGKISKNKLALHELQGYPTLANTQGATHATL